MGGQILGFDLQREPSQRAPITAAGLHQALAIAGQNREDPVDGIAPRRKGRLYDHGLESLQVAIQHRQQQGFLSREKVIETAGIGAGAVQDFGHAGGGVPALPK